MNMSTFPYDIEFEKVKEGWNEYKLSDGARLRTKLTLGKVISPPGASRESLGIQFQHSDDGSRLLQSEHERNTKRAGLDTAGYAKLCG